MGEYLDCVCFLVGYVVLLRVYKCVCMCMYLYVFVCVTYINIVGAPPP